MNELSERARLVVSGLVKGILDAERTVPYCDLDSKLGLSFAMPLIEQALLAERRLAMEEAAKIAMNDILFIHEVGHAEVRNSALQRTIALALRAAAEKEVGEK